MACWILVPRPGIKPAPPAVEARSLNYWTAREFPRYSFEYANSSISGTQSYQQSCSYVIRMGSLLEKQRARQIKPVCTKDSMGF